MYRYIQDLQVSLAIYPNSKFSKSVGLFIHLSFFLSKKWINLIYLPKTILMCRRERKDIIAIAIETGIQNTGNKLSFFYKLYRWRAIQTFYFCFTLTFLWKCIIYFLLILSSLSSAECLMYLFYARSNSFSDVFPHSYTYPTKPTDYLGPSHLQYYYPLQGRPSVSIVLTFDGVQVWPSSCCGLRWSILPAIWPPWSPSP